MAIMLHTRSGVRRGAEEASSEAGEATPEISTPNTERTGQITLDLFVTRLGSLGSHDHDNVGRGGDSISVLPEKFAHEALHAIADDCAADLAAGGDADPRRSRLRTW
jgi:hypothetical protein